MRFTFQDSATGIDGSAYAILHTSFFVDIKKGP